MWDRELGVPTSRRVQPKELRTPDYVGSFNPRDPEHYIPLEKAKIANKEHNKNRPEGAPLRVLKKYGRLGKDNPGAADYRKGGKKQRHGGWPGTMRLGDAQYVDIYHQYDHRSLKK